MFYPGPIQWYHSQFDLIWPAPFKQKSNQETIVSHFARTVISKPAP